MTNEKTLNVFEKMKHLWELLKKKDKTDAGFSQPDLFDGMDDPV
jgi:hypothetical protein